MDSGKPASRQNHYVPVWYQRGFIQGGAANLFLDMRPPRLRPDGTPVPQTPTRRSPKSCFWEQDLYVTRFGEQLNDEMETVLFAGIDDRGAGAVRAFIDGEFRRMHDAYEPFFAYMGAQMLRTPKGLDWIRNRYPALSQVELMIELQHLRHLYGTMWAEAVREIVSAEDSDVKFIVSDHPVTTFNPLWPVAPDASGNVRDAPVALNGTQTLFALDANHCLILTHLAGANDPAGVALNQPRENARSFAPTLIRTDALIRTRRLGSGDVVAINHLLKSRARRYIAAADVSWLYPEREGDVNAETIARILRPPQGELFHFGGEIYVGHNDGSVDYRDAFGRTSRAHELLAKTAPKSEPGDDDCCPCGDGLSYAECCKSRPASERPPWNVLSLRERNLTLLRAVKGILALDDDKSWDDVRRGLSDDEVSRIYGFVSALWPEDTNVASLLPRPEPGRLRAVYMGVSDPRTLGRSVIGILPLFDEIFVLNPFINGLHVRPEYNPVKTPSAYKGELLKHALFLLMLEPFIKSGHVILFPDPSDVSVGFRESMWGMAKERTKQWEVQKRHIAEFKPLLRDDFELSLTGLPDDALRSAAKQAKPDADEAFQEMFVEGMRMRQAEDPLALMQSMPSGEDSARMSVLRCANLELTLFVAQLTGAVVVTDVLAFWEQLHMHTRAGVSEDPQAHFPVRGQIAFESRLGMEAALAAWQSDSGQSARSVFREIVRKVAAGHEEDIAGQLAELNHQLGELPGPAGEDATGTHRFCLDVSIPDHGFESTTVQRLVVGFGREDAPTSVPLALYRPWNQ